MSTEQDQARDDVLLALENLREALRIYRRVAKEPPLFILEKPAPPLRHDAFYGAQVFADRHQMMRALAFGDTGGEVGVQGGNFSRFILDELSPARLHLFDLSDKHLRKDVRSDPRVSLHLGDSASQLAKLPDQSFDWLYIDGDHSYRGVRRDAAAALDKIRPGGTLIFNDYVMWSAGEAIPYGVVPCVNELINDGLDVLGVALTSTGYLDVALRAKG